MKTLTGLITSILFFVIMSCNPQVPETAHNHEESAGPSATVWTDQYEVFAEFQPTEDQLTALVHITRLADFRPVNDAKVTLTLQSEQSNLISAVAEPTSPGIYTAELKIPGDGEYNAHVRIQNAGTTELDLGEIHIHGLHDEAEEHDEHDEHEATGNALAASDLVHFTKEQQWAADFKVEYSRLSEISSTIYAIGTVIPRQNGLTDIVAPVDGFLNINHNKDMVVPGARVNQGDVLITLCPPIGKTNTWTERYTSYQLAQNNYERALNLKERGAISDTEFEKVEQTYLVEKSGFETLLDAYNITPDLQDTGCMHFFVKAPFDGVVSDMYVRAGQNISVGEKLMTLVDPSVVWVRAELYESDFNRLDQLNGATLHLADNIVHLERDDMQLVSKGITVDPENRTIPVIFKMDNHNGTFKIGQIVQMDIYTQSQLQAVIVPLQSILDEDVQKFVFVQHGGESFEKRLVETGPTFRNWVAITHGLEPGERVVSDGTYLLKLATITVTVGSAHHH